jgi:hypothetical protein
MKGMEQLILHVILYPKDIKNVIEYMDKIKLDKGPFANLLVDTAGSITYALNLYQKYTEENIAFEYKDGRFTSIRHTDKQDIDVDFDKLYKQVQNYLISNNFMNTLENNGQNIRIIYSKHTLTHEEIAELTKQNIEKMKKTLPRTYKIAKYLENIMKPPDPNLMKALKHNKSKQIVKPLTGPIKK